PRRCSWFLLDGGDALLSAEHPPHLFPALLVVQRLDPRVCRVARDLLDAEVAVRDARDLREMRDRDDLSARGKAAQCLADGVRGASADAGVDLVEDEGFAPANGCDCERDPGQLAAGGGLCDRRE